MLRSEIPMRRIQISEKAYKVLKSHCGEYGEPFHEAVDELVAVRDAAWAPTFLNPGEGFRFKKEIP